MASFDFRRANDALATNPLRLLDALGLRYRRSGQYAYVQDGPASGANSFCVFLNAGNYKDFASGRGGDLVALIGHVQNYANQLDSLKWAYAYLGWPFAGSLPPVSQADVAQRDREAAERRQAEDEAAARKAKGMQGYWAHLASGKGTLVETYLRAGRNIPVERLSHFPGSLHFDPECEHVDEDGVITEWPAMVGLILNAETLAPLGLHKTWLRRDGLGKAPVTPAKKMFGRVRGGIIPLSRGLGDLKPREAIKRGHRGPLVIGEGIETTLTVACAVPDFRSWAALSLVNMILPWPAYVDQLVILGENDTKPQARAQFDKVQAHYTRQAREVNGTFRVVRSRVGNDFNDWVAA
jgi:hypothetical protein